LRRSVIGRLIGNYRIVTELGGGAMGQVYFAEHALMGRRAAIKVIRDELSTQQDSVQRFINEARLVNRIGHPNIVEITDFGQIDSRYYIMMELLEGETLEDHLERTGTFDETEAIKIALQVADALRAAHDVGVVHRDLKPENVYLTHKHGHEEVVVKVLDFGIAKLMNSPGRESSATSPGAVLGTPQYMSPEQCQGDEFLDHRSDVYALGVVLYRMLTGTVPFLGDNVVQIMIGHINDLPTPPRLLRAELSPGIEAVILKALEKKPQDRFADMQAFCTALKRKSVLASAAVELSATLIKPRPVGDRQQPLPMPQPVESITLVSPAAKLATFPKHSPGSALAAEPKPLVVNASGQRRVGSRLAQILIERLQKGKLTLPVLPAAARECLKLLDARDKGLDRVARVIAQDPVIAPQIMRRARSALLGRGNPVRTLDQAVARLGARELRQIIVDVSARALFESNNPAIRKVTKTLWEHSVAVAVLARAVARHTGELDPEISYLAGLLHDVGKPVAASLLLEAERSTGARKDAWLGSEAWLGVIHECHREVGVELARSWDLNEEVLLAIARSDRYAAGAPNSSTSAVCFANALAKHAGVYAGQFDIALNDALLREGQQLFKVDEALVSTFLNEMRHQTSAAAYKR
jgi:putative nucleotidyltransferase with HDIG domain